MKNFVAILVALSMCLTMAFAVAEESTVSTYMLTAINDAEGNVISIEEAELPIFVLAIDGASNACGFGTEEEMVEGTYEIIAGEDDVLALYVTLTNGEETVMFYDAEQDDYFLHEEYVQKWLDLIRGAYVENIVTELKLGSEKPPMPFSDSRLLSYLQHTYWFLPNVAACNAMAKLLRKRQNRFFDDYKVIVAAGNSAGMGAKAVDPVYEAMGDPQKTNTITLSCGKLSTGVTVKPWTGILMLRNSTSPETYFQAAFRVQSPWTTKDEYGEEVILKPLCYVFDFAPNRALRQVEEYSCQLNVPLVELNFTYLIVGLKALMILSFVGYIKVFCQSL